MARLPENEVRRFLNCPGGTIDFGLIDEAIAAQLKVASGPIRLQQGIPGPNGFGNLHMETRPEKMRNIQNVGFSTFAAFVSAVASNFQKVGDAGVSGRLALIYRSNGYDLQIIIQYDPKGFWSVTTGLPYRVARCKILLDVSRTGGSEPTPKPAVVSRFETLSLPKKATIGGKGS